MKIRKYAVFSQKVKVPGFEPGTFRAGVMLAVHYHWATRALADLSSQNGTNQDEPAGVKIFDRKVISQNLTKPCFSYA